MAGAQPFVRRSDSFGALRRSGLGKPVSTKKKPRRRRGARIYVLYEGWQGEPRVQWQYRGKPKVPGCIVSDVSGRVFPPPFRWVVRARSARQACYYVHSGTQALGEDDLGILWDRATDYPTPPPLSDDLTEYWAVITWCRAPEISLWYERDDAEQVKKSLDRQRCCGGCHGIHEIVRMTRDEAERRRPIHWSSPSRLPEGLPPWDLALLDTVGASGTSPGHP